MVFLKTVKGLLTVFNNPYLPSLGTQPYLFLILFDFQALLEAPDDIFSFKYNPSDPNIIAGGCINGQVMSLYIPFPPCMINIQN